MICMLLNRLALIIVVSDETSVGLHYMKHAISPKRSSHTAHALISVVMLLSKFGVRCKEGIMTGTSAIASMNLTIASSQKLFLDCIVSDIILPIVCCIRL